MRLCGIILRVGEQWWLKITSVNGFDFRSVSEQHGFKVFPHHVHKFPGKTVLANNVGFKVVEMKIEVIRYKLLRNNDGF